MNRYFTLAGEEAQALLAVSYDPPLVVLSLLVAILSATVALYAVGQVSHARSARMALLMKLACGLSLGGGVWAMHFIGMLAADLCVSVRYDPLLTVLSMLPSQAAALATVHLMTRSAVSLRQLLTGGALMGAGIGSMHYAGMEAMVMSARLSFDPWMFGASVLIAIGLATVALWVKFFMPIRHRPLRLAVSGAVMGLAMAGMHYAGMAAARFSGQAEALPEADTLTLAALLATGTLLLSAFSLGVLALLRYRELVDELNESGERMRALLDAPVDGVITLDADGIVRSMNGVAERMFGWSERELAGRSFGVLLRPDDAERYGAHLAQFRRTREAGLVGRSRELHGQHRDGRDIPLHMTVGHARLREGDVFVCYLADISRYKDMEKALRESEEQFRSLIANMPGVAYRCLMDEHWTMLFMSDATETLTGYPVTDFIGSSPKRTFAAITHPDDSSHNWVRVEASIRSGLPFVVEYRIRHADGSWRWMWEHGSAIRDESGNVMWIDGVILDITERHSMEIELRSAKERAEQAAAARAAFLANMSHEIRTPMNAIIGFSEVMLGETLPDRQRRTVEVISQSARSLLRLLNDILDSARLERGAVELESLDFDIGDLMSQTALTLGVQAQEKGLALKVELDPRLDRFYRGDSLRIRQVLTNLIGNAIKFTGRGEVMVRVERLNEGVRFAVTDTGIGIAADRLQAIFEPFTQADASMSRRFGGTGLGTSICRQLVELMGGTISVDSTEGEGSTFSFVLPLQSGSAPATVATPDARLPAMRILVVDDVEQNVELLVSLLERDGHTVHGMTDAHRVADVLQAESVDLVLMDLHMPRIDGLQATRLIRQAEAQSGLGRVPVIALTASVLDTDREAARSAGMDGFAAKPVDMGQLRREIARVLGLLSTQAAASGGQVDSLVIDLARARALWQSDEKAHRALLRLLQDIRPLPAELSSAVAGEQADTVRQLAHRNRGAAANVGANELAAVLSRIETAAITRSAAELVSLIQTVEPAIERLELALKASFPPRVKAAAAPSHNSDPEALRRHATALRDSLGHGELDDTTLTLLLYAASGDKAAEAFILPLSEAIDAFDFPSAVRALDGLLAHCPASAAPALQELDQP